MLCIYRDNPIPLDFIRRLVDDPAMSMVSLDRQSKLSLRDFGFQFTVACTLVAGPCLLGVQDWTKGGQLLALVFTLHSICNSVRAIRRRDPLAAPSLNFWDEAIAFTACSYLVRGLAELHL